MFRSQLCSIVFNWGAIGLGDVLDLYDNRGVLLIKNALLTFPLIFTIILIILGIFSAVHFKWKLNLMFHTVMLFEVFYTITWLFNHFAWIPINYEFIKPKSWFSWFTLSLWLQNIVGLTEAYFKAYQPLNFILAIATGLYWGLAIPSLIAKPAESSP